VNQTNFKKPVKHLFLPGELYKVHRRPMQPQIVINDSNQGIKIIDPWREEVKAIIAFTENYISSGTKDQWCFRSDGNAMLVLSGENRTVCWLSLEGGQSYDLKCPPFPRIADLRYVWNEDSFLITGGKSSKVYQLEWQEGTPIFVDISSLESRRSQLAWRCTLDKIFLLNSNVLRVESDKHQMLYHNFNEEADQIGIANWRYQIVSAVVAPKPIATAEGCYSFVSREGKAESVNTNLLPISLIRLASFNKRVFVMYDYEVYFLKENGEIDNTYSAPTNFCYSDLDTIPAQNGYTSALVLGCKSLNGSDSQLLVYQLDS